MWDNKTILEDSSLIEWSGSLSEMGGDVWPVF